MTALPFSFVTQMLAPSKAIPVGPVFLLTPKYSASLSSYEASTNKISMPFLADSERRSISLSESRQFQRVCFLIDPEAVELRQHIQPEKPIDLPKPSR